MEQFVDLMVARLQALRIDGALKEGVHMEPVVDRSQMDQDLGYIALAKEEGATLAFGGELLEREIEGFYLSPALFVETENAMRINQKEVFEPVATLIKVKDYEEAIQVANDTEFGLSAGICTRSPKYASQFKRDSQVGMLMMNLPMAGVDYHVPFGGVKDFSCGAREQGSYASEFYTQVKTCYTFPV